MFLYVQVFKTLVVTYLLICSNDLFIYLVILRRRGRQVTYDTQVMTIKHIKL